MLKGRCQYLTALPAVLGAGPGLCFARASGCCSTHFGEISALMDPKYVVAYVPVYVCVGTYAHSRAFHCIEHRYESVNVPSLQQGRPIERVKAVEKLLGTNAAFPFLPVLFFHYRLLPMHIVSSCPQTRRVFDAGLPPGSSLCLRAPTAPMRTRVLWQTFQRRRVTNIFK